MHVYIAKKKGQVILSKETCNLMYVRVVSGYLLNDFLGKHLCVCVCVCERDVVHPGHFTSVDLFGFLPRLWVVLLLLYQQQLLFLWFLSNNIVVVGLCC